MLHGWPSTKAEVENELQPYWSFRDDTKFIDGTAVKGKRIIVPVPLQDEALKLKLSLFI